MSFPMALGSCCISSAFEMTVQTTFPWRTTRPILGMSVGVTSSPNAWGSSVEALGDTAHDATPRDDDGQARSAKEGAVGLHPSHSADDAVRRGEWHGRGSGRSRRRMPDRAAGRRCHRPRTRRRPPKRSRRRVAPRSRDVDAASSWGSYQGARSTHNGLPEESTQAPVGAPPKLCRLGARSGSTARSRSSRSQRPPQRRSAT